MYFEKRKYISKHRNIFQNTQILFKTHKNIFQTRNTGKNVETQKKMSIHRKKMSKYRKKCRNAFDFHENALCFVLAVGNLKIGLDFV